MRSQHSAYPSVTAGGVPTQKPAEPDKKPQSSMPKRAAKTSAPKTPRRPRNGKRLEEGAFDRPIPTLGWPAERYQLNLLGSRALRIVGIKRPVYVPEMTDYEKDHYLVVALGEDIKALRKEKQRIVAVLNSKSAGKTAFTDYFAATVAFTADLPVGVIDTNENNGTTAKLLGVSHEDTISLRHAIRDRENLKTPGNFFQIVGIHAKYPVLVIASDPNTQEPIDKADFIDMVKIAHGDVNLTVLDCGNGTSWSSNVGSVEVATDLVFVARADDEYDEGPVDSNDTFDNMVSTMWYYAQDFSEKVAKSFVVINAVRSGQDKDYCLERIREAAKKIKTTPEELGITKERMFLMPYSKHIARNRVVDLDPEVLGYTTRIAYSEVAKAILGQDVKPKAKADDGVITVTKEVPSAVIYTVQAPLVVDALEGAWK
ncbi:MAG: hypothetical protein NVSMB39_2290 [Candidatus Saccharimonadales bacterium]